MPVRHGVRQEKRALFNRNLRSTEEFFKGLGAFFADASFGLGFRRFPFSFLLAFHDAAVAGDSLRRSFLVPPSQLRKIHQSFVKDHLSSPTDHRRIFMIGELRTGSTPKAGERGATAAHGRRRSRVDLVRRGARQRRSSTALRRWRTRFRRGRRGGGRGDETKGRRGGQTAL